MVLMSNAPEFNAPNNLLPVYFFKFERNAQSETPVIHPVDKGSYFAKHGNLEIHQQFSVTMLNLKFVV